MPNQSGFVIGEKEYFSEYYDYSRPYSFSKKEREGNVVVKLNVKKAYSRVD